jgi:hypothetical protein
MQNEVLLWTSLKSIISHSKDGASGNQRSNETKKNRLNLAPLSPLYTAATL